MTPERWRQIEEIFNSAAELPAAERLAYVSVNTDGDDALKAEVEKLLASLDDADEFIESPIWTDSNFINTKAKRELSKSLDEAKNGDDDFLGQQIGVYKLTRQIGRGGMGAVYQAERADGEFHQTVAIKLIKRGMDTEFIVRRFRHERQILASFEHPFIARLLDGGTTSDGVPYFVMEYILGETLYNYCDGNRLPIRERLKVFQKVCSAIEYAHERQIIHRDIKPSNILINRSGSPKLLDFGIAKILDPDLIHESLNPTGSMLRMMTPDYASPEQVRGRDVGPASDIYSLGVLLYELLTGHRPYNFAGRALHEVTQVVCEEMPRLPSQVLDIDANLLSHYGGNPDKSLAARDTGKGELAAELLRGLDNVVMKALAKEPADRYPSVKDLSLDVSRFLKGTTVEAPKYRPHRAESAATLTPPQEQSKAIAILPFKFLNLGATQEGDDLFLGLGLADALITRLSKIRRFLVRPTSSILAFSEAVTDPIKAGTALNVDYIIDGSIKKAGERLRVTIQLLNVKENAAIWATSIDENLADVLTLEDTISNKVIEALLPQLTGSELADFAKRGTDVPEAFEQYLRGRYYFNSFTEEGLAKAFVAFHSAIAADPTYALAYCGLADYYSWLGIIGVLPPQECFLPAIEAAKKAAELDPELSEAHATLGFALHAGSYDWASAEKHLKRAIELNPGNGTAFVWYSIVLFTEGRFSEGLDFGRRGIELDPLTPFNHHNIGWGLYYSGRYEEAAEQYQRVIQMFPDYSFGYLGLSKVNRKVGNTKDAIEQVKLGNELMGHSLFSRLAEAETYAADGQIEIAKQKLADITGLSSDRYVSPYQVSLVYCYLGDFENAMLKLEEAAEIKEAWLNWMGVDPVLDPLRSDDRFEHILEQTGYRPLFSNFAKSSTDVLRDKSTDPTALDDDRPVHDLTTLMIEEGHRTSDGSTGSFSTKRNRRVLALAAGLALLIAASGLGYYFYSNSSGRSVVLRPISFQNHSLLVLPFTCTDPANENLGVGIADSMTQRLGNLKALTVLSANTGRSVREEPIDKIAAELNVTYVLRGYLDRSQGGAIIEAELVNAPANAVLWKERFSSPEEDYFALQTQIAEKLWTTLGINPLPLERQQAEKSYTASFAAYEKYLTARSAMASRSPANLRQAIGLFADAVKEDSTFAPAYVGLADAHSLLNLYDIEPPPDAYEKALEYANQALALDPDLADAHASLAYINFYHKRDRAGAELEFRRAIQMNPSYAQAHHWFALVLAAMNKPVDALSEIETAERLDPRSPSIKTAAAIVHFFSGEYDKGLQATDRALAIQPGFVPAHKVKRWIYAIQGNWDAARAAFEAERSGSGEADAPGWKIIEAQLAPLDEPSKRAALAMLEAAINADSVRGNDFTYAFEIALAYEHLGDRDSALDWLERSERAGTHSFNMIEPDRRLSGLQTTSRYRRLVEKLQRPK